MVRENPSGLGKLRAMVEAGAVTSILLELSSPELEQAKALDLVEPLDWDAIAPQPIFDEAKEDYGYGYQYYSTIMAWREDAKAPQSWQDFWDVEAFPGKRALPDYPDLHPADGRCSPTGCRSTSSIRSTSTGRSPASRRSRTALRSGGRPARSRRSSSGQRGAVRRRLVGPGRRPGRHRLHLRRRASSTWPSSSCPRAPTRSRRQLANGILYEMSVPENQAVAAEVVSYTGNSPDLEPLLPQDHIDQFPTTAANKDVQFLSNAKWWFENAEEVETRWQEFKLGL